MKIIFRGSFEKDLKSIKDPKIIRQLKKLIMKIESNSDLISIPNVKKLIGSKNFLKRK